MTTTAQITGPTHPESPWRGGEVTMRKIRRDEAGRGMLLGLFAGRPVSVDLLSVAAVDVVRMESVWEHGRCLGNRVWIGYLDEFTGAWGDEDLWIVTSLPPQEA